MAPKPTQDEPTAAADTPEGQMAEEERAAERRSAEAERAGTLRSVPEGALAPTEKQTKSGDSVFQLEHLVANSYNMLGHAPHVAVGAFHGWAKEYVSLQEAKARIERWLATEAVTDSSEEAS